MHPQFRLVVAGLGLATLVAAAADETAAFRQRHRLDPAKAKANAARVADDLAAAGKKNAAAAAAEGGEA